MSAAAKLAAPSVEVLAQAPAELTAGRLVRLGEGIGSVVYASEHWVVRRGRSPSEVVALIMLWKAIRRMERWLPGGAGRNLLARPSRQIRFLRVLTQASMAVIPKALWFTTHIRKLWMQYHRDNARGKRLAREVLAGSSLVPRQIDFPPTRVKVGGWPGWLTVSEATERVEQTLHQRLADLASRRQYQHVELWLNRLLETRQLGWRFGLYSMDAHLKNFGVIADRIVLIDAGGLTNRWSDVERHLARSEAASPPHVQLGLGAMLADCPEVAARFDERWRSVVTRGRIRNLWKQDAAGPG